MLLSQHTIRQHEKADNSYKLAFQKSNSDVVNLGNTVVNGVRTISFWIKLTSNVVADDTVLSRYITANGSGALDISFNTGNIIKARINNGVAYTTITTTRAFVVGEWYNVVLRLDATDGARIFVNGVSLSPNNTTNNLTNVIISNTTNTYVGGSVGTSDKYSNFELKELKLFTTALTQEEIISEMTYHPNGLEEGYRAYYPLNESSGITINDVTNTYNGTISTSNPSGASYINSTIWQITPYTDYNHINFIKTNNEAVSLSTDFLNGIRTIEFWIKLTATPVASDTILNRNINAANNNRFLIYLPASGKIEIINWDGAASATNRIVTSNSALAINTWIHVAYSIDPTSGAKLYINGVQQTSTASDTNAITSVNGTVSMMADLFFNIRYVNGQIKELKTWNTVRTPSEITSDMTSIPTGSEAGLVSYIPLLQLEGNKIYDFKDTFSGTLTSIGTINDMWQLTNPQIKLNNRLLHYDYSNTACYPGSGTAITDLSPNAKNGTVVGALTFNNTTKGFVWTRVAGRYIQTTLRHTSAVSSDFTVTIPFKTSSFTTGDSGLLISNYATVTTTTHLYNLYILGASGAVYGGSRNENNTKNAAVITTETVNDNIKRTTTYRKKGDRFEILIDGVLKKSQVVASFGTSTPAYDVVLGVLNAFYNQGMYDGEMYGVVIYNKALTYKEIEINSKKLLE